MRVCSCTPGEDAEVARLGIRRGDEWISSILTEPSVWGDAGLRIARADLDGDGVPEIIGQIFRSASCGMVVARWKIVIWDGAHLPAPPVSFAVEDLGEGSFARWPGEPGCRILATSWGGGVDPKRGAGTYQYGRWSRYSAGRLEPTGSRGILARRLLQSFWKERSWPYAPLRWLRDGKVERLPDPFLPRAAGPQRTGAVASADVTSERVSLTIAFADGTTGSYCYGSCPEDDHRIARLADGIAGAAYPEECGSPELLAWPFLWIERTSR